MITIETAMRVLQKTMSEQDGRCMDDEEDREAFAEHFRAELRLAELEKTIGLVSATEARTLQDFEKIIHQAIDAFDTVLERNGLERLKGQGALQIEKRANEWKMKWQALINTR